MKYPFSNMLIAQALVWGALSTLKWITYSSRKFIYVTPVSERGNNLSNYLFLTKLSTLFFISTVSTRPQEPTSYSNVPALTIQVYQVINKNLAFTLLRTPLNLSGKKEFTDKARWVFVDRWIDFSLNTETVHIILSK